MPEEASGCGGKRKVGLDKRLFGEVLGLTTGDGRAGLESSSAEGNEDVGAVTVLILVGDAGRELTVLFKGTLVGLGVKGG